MVPAPLLALYGRIEMRKLGLALAAVLTIGAAVGAISIAWAACPPGTSYQCQQGYNGKVICACR